MIDNLNPYTVGYSEQMMRYALSVGREMGLSGQELLDLGLAARFSNIGVIGLRRELLTKEGRYTEFEYESMKMHCEIGASMVTLATGNRRAASYILHHHERVDGYGYPYGLKGEAIPLGARILYVVQFYLAKVNGRAWRDPVPFEEAIAALLKAVGTQLDGEVVNAFITWLTRVQTHPEVQGKPLAACHEMLSVPKEICESCLVYAESGSIKCWELGDNACQAHGRTCATCVVRTEYLHRQKHLRKQVQ
jgi:HD-GYP domain-containing protein (c-di-GMP phosphodiesterase class II)